MGKELIIKDLVKKAKIMIAAGVLILLILGSYSLLEIIKGNYSSLVLLCALGTVIGIVCIVIGIMGIISPEKSFAVRSNPEIFDMAEEHFSNIRFKNDYVVLSDRMISAASYPASVSYMDEVFWVYVEKQKTNLVTTGKELIFDTARGIHRINIINIAMEDVENNIIRYFAEHCPNAAIGYSADNMVYRDKMKAQWKQSHK